VPVFKVNAIQFLRGDKIKFSIVAPPFYNIDDNNDTITIDTVDYKITQGFYASINSVIDSFNTAITATSITLSINDTTGLITISHASTNFDFSKCLLLGFESDSTGDKTYTATIGNSLGYNTLSFCSNLVSLFPQLNYNKQRETFHPKNYIFSFLNSSVNSYNYISSEWLSVQNNLMFDTFSFGFGYNDSSSPQIITNIIYNWSVIVEIMRE